jgi:hypothetical protein
MRLIDTDFASSTVGVCCAEEGIEEPLFEEHYGKEAAEDPGDNSEREAIKSSIDSKEWELEIEMAAPKLRNPSNVSALNPLNRQLAPFPNVKLGCLS